MKDFPSWIQRQLPSGMTRAFFHSKFGKIHYMKKGIGHPILFLHGNPTWGFLWRKVISELNREDCQYIVPDLFNLGFSDSLSGDHFTMENIVEGLGEFINTIDSDKITLVIQDWGGPIGLNLASKLKNKIRGLVILNTGVAAPRAPYKVSKFHTMVQKKVIPEIMFYLLRFPLYTLHKVQADKLSISSDVARAYRYPIAQKWRWGSALKYARLVPNNDQHPSYPQFVENERFCREFQGPVHLVWGTQDPILGRQLKRAVEVLNNPVVIEVEAGHFLQEECPTEIATAITNNLNS